jgi:hypothetical protein
VGEQLDGDCYLFLSGFREELTLFELVFLESSFEELSFDGVSFAALSFEESLFDESSDLPFSSFFESELPPSDAGACDLLA